MANIYAGLDQETLIILAAQKKAKNDDSFIEKQIRAHEDRKEKKVKLQGTEEILRRSMAIKANEMEYMTPDDPALKATAEAIKACGESYKIVDDALTVDKKLLVPIVGAGVVAGTCYGLEKLGHINLTGGLKTIGSGALRALTGKLGKS